MKREYGITWSTYMDLYQAQHGLCAVCQNQMEIQGLGTGAHIDHDHNTQHIRGLLCTTCNVGLGMFKDSPELLQKAMEYLDGYPERVRTYNLALTRTFS